MLLSHFDAWKEQREEQWKEANGSSQGEAKGKTEGKSKGIDLSPGGEIRRGGAILAKRIRGAKLVTLERRFKRAIVAPDLRSVFNPPH